MVKKINMKVLYTILFMLTSCFTNELVSNVNVYQISIISLKESDKPYPIIILTNIKNYKSDFPKQSYQLDKKDLESIEKNCNSFRKSKNLKSLILVEINKNNKIKKYFFGKQDGVEILVKIQKITSDYNEGRLNSNLYYLQKVTKLE
ncbi:hypothetical protein [Chryseobacterium sp. CCH4-E10]|uniref:hypothetical protein n=1 Tax=Chryseobacterium sp. CCH4-E10 TaxID=1768758 RepID=UPI00082EB0EB|nr:hypothetical protein [Chryseobacterium sp. CCH4-E10]